MLVKVNKDQNINIPKEVISPRGQDGSLKSSRSGRRVTVHPNYVGGVLTYSTTKNKK